MILYVKENSLVSEGQVLDPQTKTIRPLSGALIKAHPGGGPEGEAEAEKAKEICREIRKRIPDMEILDLLTCEELSAEEKGKLQGELFRGKFSGGEGKTELRMRNYAGVLSYRDEAEGEEHTLHIGSRFDKSDGGRQFFLSYMLERCWRLDTQGLANLFPEGAVQQRAGYSFDVLLAARFMKELKQALKKGEYRIYRYEGRNDSHPRGQIDIPRHIRENAGPENGRIAYRIREYTADNMYNALFLRAVRLVRKKYPKLTEAMLRRDRVLETDVRLLEKETQGWETLPVQTILKGTEKRIRHSVYRAYEPLRLTARAILKRLGLDIDGTEQKAPGIVVDVSKLWESFLETAVFAGLPEGYRVRSQYEADTLGGEWRIRPDFCWEQGLVLDAKYREIWGKTILHDLRLHGAEETELSKWENRWIGAFAEEKEKKNIRENIYQVLAYMLILGNRYGGVIFPVSETEVSRVLQERGRLPLAAETETGSALRKIGWHFWVDAAARGNGAEQDMHWFLRLPCCIADTAADYGEFCRCMREREQELRNQIRDCLRQSIRAGFSDGGSRQEVRGRRA